jgi:hypothetical protein
MRNVNISKTIIQTHRKPKKIIILSQGRSGSTLLQRILHCSIPDASLKGENWGFWTHIFRSYQAWRKTDAYRINYDRTDNCKPDWFNTCRSYHLVEHYRSLFDTIYDPSKYRVVGFKEIRFPTDPQEFEEYIRFFQCLFPEVMFIFTVRNIESLIKSGWWQETDREKLLSIENLLRDFVANNPDVSFLIPYEDLLQEERIRDVFRFIDEPFHLDIYQDVISRIL